MRTSWPSRLPATHRVLGGTSQLLSSKPTLAGPWQSGSMKCRWVVFLTGFVNPDTATPHVCPQQRRIRNKIKSTASLETLHRLVSGRLRVTVDDEELDIPSDVCSVQVTTVTV